MEQQDPQTATFRTKQEKKFQTKQRIRSKSPPPLHNRLKRPWKGIFLTYFLFFCGWLFAYVGYQKYNEYTGGQVFVIWLLSLLLLIPGGYFGALILMIQLRMQGFSYSMVPELQN